MAVTILSESYGPRKPFVTCTAGSLDDLAGLVCAEGSTATVDGTEYVLDRVNGWVVPGGGGGGSSSGPLMVTVTETSETFEGDPYLVYTCDKTYAEILAALEAGTAVWIAGCSVLSYGGNPDDGYSYVIYPRFSVAYPFNAFSADTEHPYPAFWVNNTIN